MSESEEKDTTPERMREALIRMAVESWRFGKVFERLLQRLDAGEKSRFASRLRWFLKQTAEGLESAGLKTVDVEGQPYDPGLAATPLNLDEFDSGDSLIVDQMLDPVIMGREGIVRTGTVILRKVES